MEQFVKYFKYAFFAISTINILSQLAFLNLQILNTITKPMLMPALALYFFISTKNTNEVKLRKAIFIALFFAWLGDVLLMFAAVKPIFFMLGLGAFLVMQICYILIFKPLSFKNLWQFKFIVLPIILFGLITMSYLLPKIGNLKIPVIVYFIAIICMVLASINYRNKDYLSGIIFLGAVLFMLSDSLIAINKFSMPIPFSGFMVMLTYILAQWFIIDGLRIELEN